MRRLGLGVLAVSVILACGREADADPFTPGNLVIYRVGDGSAALNGNATAVFVDEYTTAGALVQSIALPTTLSGDNRRLTSSGNATSEGFMTRSVDGGYLVLTGYDAAQGTAAIAGTTSATVNRVIGRIDNAGVVNTTAVFDTSPQAYNTGNPRGVASTDGTNVWASGTGSAGVGGSWHTTVGGTTDTQVSSTVNNSRATGIFGGQLFISSASGAFRLAKVGDGTPTTTGNTATELPGIGTTDLTSPYAFFFADLNGGVSYLTTGLDTLYVADDGLNVVKKFTFDGTNWVADGTITLAGARGLTGVVNGTDVTLYATAAGTGLHTTTDTSGYDGTFSGSFTQLATAASNTAFRGVALTPAAVPEPSAFALGGLVLLIGSVGFVARRASAVGPKRS